MPEQARVLQFRQRSSPQLNAAECLRLAADYYRSSKAEVSDERRELLVSQPDVLLSLCALLREQVDQNPAAVCQESIALYRCIGRQTAPVGSFDERDYFLGETALLAAGASRLLGKRADAEVWLDRAEGGYRHTINPSPLLANVTYQRLALRCESGRYEEVAELAPMLAASFARLSMPLERAKCTFLEGVALKGSGNHRAAVDRFEAVRESGIVQKDPGLAALALVYLADIHVADGRDDLASSAYAEAVPLLQKGNRPAAVAHLKVVIGETLRRQGKLSAAIDAYAAAVADYDAIQMATWVAYVRVVLAQTLIEANRSREAEWQILAALPTIDEQRMVPEGFAAVALLRESVRQRKADPKALLELREYLKARQ